MLKWTDAESKLIYALDAWQVCKISYILKMRIALKWTDALLKHLNESGTNLSSTLFKLIN